MDDGRVARALELLDLHFDSFASVAEIARDTGHPVPVDTRGWSQILVSVLYGVKGPERRKGADLVDGSDVKAANTWEAIDTPRFNGVIKADTQAETSGRLESLDSMPYLFFVLWDHAPVSGQARCRIWVVRTQVDEAFRAMCQRWYEQRTAGIIRSTNFHVHPPRNLNINTFRNNCGNLDYPLYFHAERPVDGTFQLVRFNEEVLRSGQCVTASAAEAAQVPLALDPGERG